MPQITHFGGIPVPRVLLADDSTHAQRMGTKILTAEGFQVVTVSNGEAAAKKLPDGNFDLVMADVFMPGRSGYELCSFVKSGAETSHVPVILVVGQLEPYDPEQGERVAADGVLTKPFEASKVVEMVKRVLQEAAQKKEAAAAPPPPPPPPLEEMTVPVAEAAPAPQPEPPKVQPEMEQAAFGLFIDEVTAPPVEAAEPASVSGAFTAPAEAAAEAPAMEPPPEPSIDAGVAAPPLDFELPVEPAAGAELIVEPEQAPAEAAPAPASRWTVRPSEVTDADRGVFPTPAQAAAATAAAPGSAPDWADLLKHVEEPIAPPVSAAAPVETAEAPAAAATASVAAEAPAIEAPGEQTIEEPAAAPSPETSEIELAAVEASELLVAEEAPIAAKPAEPQLITEAEAAEPILLEPETEVTIMPAEEPVAAVSPALDAESVRAAVEAGLDHVGMQGLKAVPGLVDKITTEILRRL